MGRNLWKLFCRVIVVVLFALHAVAKGEPISIFRFKICLFSQFVTFKFYVLDLEASERRKKGDKYSHIQAKVQCFVSTTFFNQYDANFFRYFFA